MIAVSFQMGCAATDPGLKVLKVRHEEKPPVEIVPKTAKYEVAMRLKGMRELVHYEATKITLHQGDTIGFALDCDGSMTAVGGGKRFVLPPLPVHGDYYCWYQHPKHDLQKDTNRLMRNTGTIVYTTTLIAAGAGLWVGSEIAGAEVDDQIRRLEGNGRTSLTGDYDADWEAQRAGRLKRGKRDH